MIEQNAEQKAETAKVLIQALPYLLQYDEAIIVVKYGGHAMGDKTAALNFARDMVLLKTSGIHPVVVHGGGPQIGQMLEKLNITSTFKDGFRITDEKTVEVVEMVLAGTINKQIVSMINRVGGKAVGLCGKDGDMMMARRLSRTTRDPESNIETVMDLGFVGEPEKVNVSVIKQIINSDIIPVIAPVAGSITGETYNMNADTFAGAIAGALEAERLLLLTDVQGVLDKNKTLLPELTVTQAKALINDGTVTGGMIPKIETCFYALEKGVKGVVIVNGQVPHAVLVELLTEGGAGTFIRP